MIDPIPKNKAEQMLDIIREGMEKVRKANVKSGGDSISVADELGKYAKLKEQGVLTEEEFSNLKKDLLEKISEAKGEQVKIPK